MSDSAQPNLGAVAPPLADVEAQIGRAFPGGEYALEPWRMALFADVVLDEKPREIAHPVLAWVAATGAMGISWDELFRWFGATAADGPMFGEHRTTFHRPLRVGETLVVSGKITSAQRKSGRRAGVFDLVGYEFELHEKDSGEHVATCWNSIVFPRRT